MKNKHNYLFMPATKSGILTDARNSNGQHG